VTIVGSRLLWPRVARVSRIQNESNQICLDRTPVVRSWEAFVTLDLQVDLNPYRAAPMPAPGPGFAQCGDRLVPLAARVTVANPVGTLMYEAFLHATRAQVSPPPN
jgi:hypothetical protein